MKCKNNKKNEYKRVSKYCSWCLQEIDQENPEVKWCMNITKQGQKIIEFECFHLECWREFLEESLKIAIKNEQEIKRNEGN